ncbi:MAG: RsiV family protein [Romboutsia sp.]
MTSIEKRRINNLNYPIIKDIEIDKQILNKVNNRIYEDILCFNEIVQTEDENIEFALTEYEVNLNKNKIISISIEFSQLAGICEITYINTYNYDLSKGKELDIDSIFNENTNYLKKINGEIQEKINEIIKKQDEFYINIDKEQSFYIKEDKIVICFSSYELGDRFQYPIEINIMFKDYKNYLDNYVLSNIYKI